MVPDDTFIKRGHRHLHAHNHTNMQKRESYIIRTVFKFFLLLTFSDLMVGLRLMKIIET